MKAEHICILSILYEVNKSITTDELGERYKEKVGDIEFNFLKEYKKDSLQIILANFQNEGFVGSTKEKGSHDNKYYISDKGLKNLNKLFPIHRKDSHL